MSEKYSKSTKALKLQQRPWSPSLPSLVCLSVCPSIRMSSLPSFFLVSLGSPGRPGTCSVDQTSLELIETHLTAC